MALRWFNKDIWGRLGLALVAIQKELQGLQPKDSSTIKWEVSETGITAHAIATAPYSAPTPAIDEEEVAVAVDTEYAGYFKVIMATDTTVSVIDGAAPASGICGYYQHGIQHIEVQAPSPIFVNQNGFIVVLITYTTQYVFTFAFRTSMPTPVNGVLVRKLADITFADGKITTITQVQNGVLTTPGVM